MARALIDVLLLKEVLGRVIHILLYSFTLETEHIEEEKSEGEYNHHHTSENCLSELLISPVNKMTETS